MKPKAAKQRARNVVTLADLVPKHRIAGGGDCQVFGADPLSQEMIMAKKTNLPVRKNVTGGTLGTNDSLTPTRAAKKDLPPGKDVKGGKSNLGAKQKSWNPAN